MKEYRIVILAAGEGTRMKSKRPKVLHQAAGVPLLGWVMRAAQGAGPNQVTIVCGRGKEEIESIFGESAGYAEQTERLGSGHAVMCARPFLEGFDGYTFIIAGDMPLLRGETLQAMARQAEKEDYACILLSAELDNPFGYGRIVRDAAGMVSAIVEEKDATDEQRRIREVNASCYLVKNELLLEALKEIKPNNVQGEYYLTDIVDILRAKGQKVGAHIAENARECMGVNDRVQLAEVSALLQRTILETHMRNGVTIIDPAGTYIDPDTQIGQDTTIYPGVTLEKGCVIGEDVTLYPGSRISNSTIEDGTTVQNAVVLDAKVGKKSTVGPYAYLRPGTSIGDGCRVGDFVEVKNSNIGDGTKVSHLTYVGDADLGKNINIGCGVVFVNYDGKRKFRSVIEDDVFIGCNTNLISPVHVGKGAYIAAGSTITEDLPEDSFAIARARQVVKTGWKDKRED